MENFKIIEFCVVLEPSVKETIEIYVYKMYMRR